MVSLSCPHDVPVRARKMLMRDPALAAIDLACCENENMGSKMTPRIFGCCSRARVSFPQQMPGLWLYCAVWGVKRVECDLGIETVSPFSRAHSPTSAACLLRVSAALSGFTADAAAVKSSACELVPHIQVKEGGRYHRSMRDASQDQLAEGLQTPCPGCPRRFTSPVYHAGSYVEIHLTRLWGRVVLP